MSNIRRRPVNQGESSNGQSKSQQQQDHDNTQTATQTTTATEAEKPTLSPLVRLKRYLAKPRGKRRHSFVFLLGGLFGIFVALFFANQNEVISLDALMDLNLDSLIDVMPQGLLRDAKELTVCSRLSSIYNLDSYIVQMLNN